MEKQNVVNLHYFDPIFVKLCLHYLDDELSYNLFLVSNQEKKMNYIGTNEVYDIKLLTICVLVKISNK